MPILCIFTQACFAVSSVFFLVCYFSRTVKKKLSEQNVVAKFSVLCCCLAQQLGK